MGVGQSFHHSPPPTLPISCILLHYSPLFHVFFYHVNPLFHWPAYLSSSCFQLQHFLYLYLLISSYNMSEPPQSFLPQMLLQIIHSHSRCNHCTLNHILQRHSADYSPLCGSQPLKNPCFIAQVSAPYINMLRTHALYTTLFILKDTPHVHNIPPSSLNFIPAALTLAATACSTAPVSFNISPKYANS